MAAPAAIAAVAVAAGAALSFASCRRAHRAAERTWRDIASRARRPTKAFDPAMVEGLPKIARRYFTHAIAPGTPLSTTAELKMEGIFLLGSKDEHRRFRMTARQILAPPTDFVWMPRMQGGPLRISGSDALVAGSAWTRFWLNGLVPVANARSSPNLIRSATFRAAMEGIWVPATLLPENGAVWEQIGDDRARVTIGSTSSPIVLELTLDSAGAVREVSGLRWSNANADKAFRLQPFGGAINAEDTFGGYTVPTVLSVGNHFGTENYLPFFQVEITDIAYL